MTQNNTSLERAEAHTPVQTPDRTAARATVFMPRADIYETSDALVVLADMPGVEENAVDISLDKNELSIRGSVKVPSFEGQRLTHEEYAIGDYARSFTIGNDIDRANISATMKNGVLKLVLPKSQQSLARKIVVKSE